MGRTRLISVISVFIAAFVLVGLVQAQKRDIPIFKIPPEVTDNLGKTREMLMQVQDSMATKVHDLETMLKTYKETCEGDTQDRGCAELLNQVKQQYLQVLKTLEKEMPKIKSTISQTADQLGKTLKAKTRYKSVKDLYENVSKKNALPPIRGPLSKKLNEIVSLMRKSRGGRDVSPLELSLQTQADLIASADAMNYLEAEITRQRLFVETVVSFGDLSPMIGSVMASVSEIFDYDIEAGEVPVPDVGVDAGGAAGWD